MPLTGPGLDLSKMVEVSFFDALSKAEEERQKDIVLARKYHDGEHGVELTRRLKEFLGTEVEFRMNVCRSVVTAVAERLNVTGFDAASPELIKWAWSVWEANSLDAVQEEIYEAALRDGEHFLIVDWNSALGIPRMIPQMRYTDSSTGGDGDGCWIAYNEGDPHQDILFGVKQWTVFDEADATWYQRQTRYYPDRIEKYRRGYSGDWEEYMPSGDSAWPLPWVDRYGKPLGVAVVPFNNKGLRIEAWDAFPLQNAVNKALVDLLASSDLTAFRVFYALGFIPTSDGRPLSEDGSNKLVIEPGQVIGTSKNRRDAEFGAINPAELGQQQDLVHQLVLWLAMVTNTPVSRFVSTKLIASDATLKEQEGPLISRVTAQQTRFGNAWTNCFTLAARLVNTFGSEEVSEDRIAPIWGEAAARGESERLDLLLKKQQLGVPQEQLWREAGYDQVKISEMLSQKQEKESRDGRGTEPNPPGDDAGGGEDQD